MHSYNSRKTDASDDILMGNLFINFGRPQLTRDEKNKENTLKNQIYYTLLLEAENRLFIL